MARSNKPRRQRNTAPMWKKVAVVLSGPVAIVVIASPLHASTWGFLPFLGFVIVVVVAAVWLTAKLLGVRLSLHSWD